MKPVVAKMMSSFLAAAALLAWRPATAGPDYLERLDVRSFIESMHEKHGIEMSDLERIMPSFQGKLSIDEEGVAWYRGVQP